MKIDVTKIIQVLTFLYPLVLRAWLKRYWKSRGKG